MLQGAQYADAIKGTTPEVRNHAFAMGVIFGFSKSLELLGSLASHADPVPTGKPEHKLSDEEKLFQSWKP